MSKYDVLWEQIQKIDSDVFVRTFAELETMAGFPLDHSFLSCKKELAKFGYEVVKISLKEKTVSFRRRPEAEGERFPAS